MIELTDGRTGVIPWGRDAAVCLVTLLVVFGTVAPVLGGSVAASPSTDRGALPAQPGHDWRGAGAGAPTDGDGAEANATEPATADENESDDTDPDGGEAAPDEDPALPDAGAGVAGSGVGTAATGVQVGVSQINREAFPRIQVFATVANGSNAPVDGLGKSNFELTEDGRSEEIAAVRQVSGSEVTDVSTALLIDRSGSMEGAKLDNARQAATAFVGRFRAGDEAQVMSFGDGVVRTDQPWTRDETALNRSIDRLRADGGTPLYEAVISGVAAADGRAGRSAVVVVTDGKSTGETTPAEAIDAANRRDVPVYTIGIGSGVNTNALRELATRTNGQYYAASSNQLSAVYRGISRRLASEYRITYRTTNETTDGGRRTVRVDTTSRGNRGSAAGSYEAPCAPLPTARLDYTRTDRTVRFDAGRSDSGGSTLVAFRWDFDNDGRVDATGTNVSHTYASTGDYQVRLQVEKACGATDSTVQTVTVTDGLGIDVAPSQPTANETVVVSATNPDAVDASDRSFTWEFGDGETATGRRAGHEYARAGRYRLNLTVVTAAGSETVSTTVVVRSDAAGGLDVDEVFVSPSVPFPAGLDVRKAFSVSPDAPRGVDRVEFAVGGDTYVDRTGRDGWTVDVPVRRYEPGDTVEATVYGAGGDTASATAEVGLVEVGPVLEAIVRFASGELLEDRVTFSRRIPRGGPRTASVALGPIGTLKARLGSQAGATLYREDTALEVTGRAEGTAKVPGVRSEGSGDVTGRVDNTGRGWEVRRVVGEFDISGSASKRLEFRTAGVGFTASLRVGPFVRGSPIVWGEPARFPSPTSGEVEGGVGVTGNVVGSAIIGKLTGKARGEGGLRSRFPRLTEDVTAFGRIYVVGTVDTVFGESKERRYTVWEAGVGVTDLAARDSGRLVPRSKRGTVPRLGGVDTRALGDGTETRLTTDGLADESPSLAATGTGVLLVWDRQAADRSVAEGRDVFARTRTNGTWGPRTRVTNDTVMDFDAAVAAGPGGEALAAWTRLNRSYADVSRTNLSRTFRSADLAVAVRSNGSWSAPVVVANGSAAAVDAQVAAGDGRYVLAWRYDADGNRTTLTDRGVRYATYDPASGLGAVREAPGARAPQVAGDAGGLRVAYFRPSRPGGDDGTVVVRNVTAGTRREVPATAFRTLAASPSATAWVNGTGTNASLRYAPDGRPVTTSNVSEVVPTSSLELHDDVGGATAGITFRGQPIDRTAESGVFARYRGPSDWTPATPLVRDRGSVVFSEPAAASTDDDLVAVAMGRNVSDGDQYADLIAARRPHEPDLNVTAAAAPELTTADGTPVVVGIVNRGAVAAENLTVRVSDDGRTLARVDAGAADVAGIVVTGTTVNSSVRDVSVAVTGSSPGGTANEPNASGRTVTATDPSVTVARPDLAVASVDRTVRADAVRYDATVVNAGTAPVSNATVALTSGNRTVTTAAVASLPPDGTASVALTAPADDVPGGVVTRVVVDAPGPADLNASNDAVRVTAPLPDLFVPGDGVRTVTSGGTCGETTASGGELVCALVGNRGAAPTTATVTVESTNRTVTRRTSLPGSGAEATTFTAVAVPVAALNVSDGERVTVSARADGFDARPSDNVGTSVVQTTVATDTPFPSGVPGVSGSTPPTDTDGDRRLEDVTGDGRFDFFDVIEFLFALDSLSDEPLTERQRTALDHDGDGSLTFFDVIDLLFQL